MKDRRRVSKASKAFPRRPRGASQASVYENLRNRIVTAQLKLGQRLPDRVLAHELGVSRTPVREALNRLEQEGLVGRDPGSGYFVREMDRKEIADLYSLREALEVHAFELASEKITPADIGSLEETLQSIDGLSRDPKKRGEEIRVGLEIHLIIARASGNRLLYDTLSRLLDRMMSAIWMEMLYEDEKQKETTRRDHKEIVQALKSQSVEEGRRLVRLHIQQAKDHILGLLEAKDAFYSNSVGRGDGRQ